MSSHSTDGLRGGLAVRVHYLVLKAYQSLLDLKSIRTRKGRALHKTAVLRIAKFLLRGCTVKFLVRAIERRATRFPYASSTHVGVTVWAYRERIPNYAYGEPSRAQFEGRFRPVPADHDLVLRKLFGDYRSLPPEDERTSHHDYSAFWRDSTD